MSIEGIVLEHFSSTVQPGTESAPKSCTRHAMFHYFFSDKRKQDSATTGTHRKRLIKLLNQRYILSEKLITPWENTYDFSEHYICATELYLLSMLSQKFYVIIYRSISKPGHRKEAVDDLNTTEKKFHLQLMSTVKLPVQTCMTYRW